jgi:hypothetical protein
MIDTDRERLLRHVAPPHERDRALGYARDGLGVAAVAVGGDAGSGVEGALKQQRHRSGDVQHARIAVIHFTVLICRSFAHAASNNVATMMPTGLMT